MAHAVRAPYSGVGQRTRPVGRGNPPGSAVPSSLVGRQCEVPGARGDPDAAMVPGDPSARSPGQSRALLPVIGVSGFFITPPYPDTPLRFRAKGNSARDT